jgi:hypothetical protein
LAERGDLIFASPEETGSEPVTEPAVALPKLLSPYMHMTNNRLHVTIRDEAYLAHVLVRVLRADIESAGGGSGIDGNVNGSSGNADSPGPVVQS